MFRYSQDEYIASEQIQSAYKMLAGIQEKCKIKESPEIDKLFTGLNIDSYIVLKDINKMSKECKDEIVFAGISRDNYNASSALWELKKGYDFFKEQNKTWGDTIPYIEVSFTDSFKTLDGATDWRLQHIFLFFFTKYHDYEGARDCVLYYLKKFQNLKAFL
jgi:hypothetical protein